MRPLRLLAFIEAKTVTGPAKNLIEFARLARVGTASPTLVETTLATFRRGGEPSDLEDAAGAAGVPVVRIPERSGFDRKLIHRLRGTLESCSPDLIQTHAVKSHFLLYLSGLWKRCPWVAFHHGYTTEDVKMRVYNQLDRISLRVPARLLTVSRAFERQLIQRGVRPDRIDVLHNAVDPVWVERVQAVDRLAFRHQLGVAPAEKLVLAIGRMSREKALIDLVAAFRAVRAWLSPLRLVLVGDGPERTALERAAGEGVLFPGQVRDPAPYYAIADLLVLPSLTEGSPNVLLEAMAAGVPVVATGVGGVPEIVRHRESALLVRPSDPPALAAAMREVLGDPSLAACLRRTARGVIASRHSPETRVRRLTGIYASLVSRPARPA